MFKKSKVSVEGRWIISLIFFFTFLLPEAAIMALASRAVYPKYIIGMSLVRLMWSAPLYYFTMLGRSWARAITIVLLMCGAAMLVTAVPGKSFGIVLLILCIFVVSAWILISAKKVRPRDGRR
jgi:hypothetical protein